MGGPNKIPDFITAISFLFIRPLTDKSNKKRFKPIYTYY
jgi:hypothetical protein